VKKQKKRVIFKRVADVIWKHVRCVGVSVVCVANPTVLIALSSVVYALMIIAQTTTVVCYAWRVITKFVSSVATHATNAISRHAIYVVKPTQRHASKPTRWYSLRLMYSILDLLKWTYFFYSFVYRL